MRKKIPLVLAACLLVAPGCSKKEEKEAEPVVPVQVTPVRQDSIRRVVVADAVLYPRDQASVMPKISAPVREVLREPRRPRAPGRAAGRAGESRPGGRGRSKARASSTRPKPTIAIPLRPPFPKESPRRRRDVQSATAGRWTPRRSCSKAARSCSREGALARRLVDEAQVAFAQARAQYEAAEEHLKALQSVGKQEQIKRRRPRWKRPGAIISPPRPSSAIRRSAAPSRAWLRTGRSTRAKWPAPALRCSP